LHPRAGCTLFYGFAWDWIGKATRSFIKTAALEVISCESGLGSMASRLHYIPLLYFFYLFAVIPRLYYRINAGRAVCFAESWNIPRELAIVEVDAW